MSQYRTQPPWEFLLTASRNSLQSYELSRLSHAANLRKEIHQLLESWIVENSAAMLARWLMEHRERSTAHEAGAPPESHGTNGHTASDNFLRDYSTSRQENRGRW